MGMGGKTIRNIVVGLAGLALAATGTYAQQAASSAPATAPTKSQKTIEAFLRNYYALGSDFTITVGTPKPIGN